MGNQKSLKSVQSFQKKRGYTGLHVSLDEGNTFPKWPQYLHGHFSSKDYPKGPSTEKIGLHGSKRTPQWLLTCEAEGVRGFEDLASN